MNRRPEHGESEQRIECVTAEGWTQLLDELYRDTWDPEIGRHRSRFVYRGVDTRDCDLMTGLARIATDHRDIRRTEGHLLRNFRKYASAEFSLGSSHWRWLTFAQHHGLPTRLERGRRCL